MEKGVPSMNLHIRRKRKFDDERQPNRKRREGRESGDRPDVVGSTGAAAMRTNEPDSEWPWWLSLPTTEGDPASRVSDGPWEVGRPLPAQDDESDQPTSLPAA
jgi:hypothetical protein